MNEPDYPAISQRFKSIREALRMNQKQMAREMGVSPASISEIEQGHNKPRHDVVYNLTAKFSVNINYLLHGSGEMFIRGVVERSIIPEVYGEHTEFLKKFLRYFKESTLVRYAMIAYIQRYLLENESLIHRDIERKHT
jgi:transcriptional regulator with XRE-family HTH domain